MSSSFNRRDFLHRSGRLLAGTAAAAMLSRSALAASARADLTLACGDATLSRLKEPDCWTALRAIGATGVEATISEDLSLPRLSHPERKYSVATPEDLAALKADMRAAGCKITAFAMHNQFDVRPDAEIEWTAKAAQAAQALGVPAIRIDVVTRKADLPDFLEFSVKTLKKVIAATESTGVVFGVENHGKTTNDPEFLDALFAGVGSDRLGLTLDTGNFYWFGHPLSKVYALFERFAPRVFHTHCKSIKYPADQREAQRPMGWEYGKFTCPIDQGDIDFHRVVKILLDAGYKNDLNVEDESLGKLSPAECKQALLGEIQHLRQCLADA